MVRLLKISLFAAAILSPINAQNASSPDLSPPIRNAIDRLIKGAAAGPRTIDLKGRFPAEVCSVPLHEMHIDNPQQFTMRTAPPPSTGDPMPRAQAPAPPCTPAARSAEPRP